MHPNNIATSLKMLPREEDCNCSLCSNKVTYTQHTILKDLKCKSCLWSLRKILVNKIEKDLQLTGQWGRGQVSNWGNQYFKREYLSKHESMVVCLRALQEVAL